MKITVSETLQKETIHHKFDVSELIIGRGGKSALILKDRTASLEHAVLSEINERELLIKDLGSVGGTFVNGYPQKECRLSSGDVFRIGNTECRVAKNDVWELEIIESDKNRSFDINKIHSALTLNSYIPSTLSISIIFILIISLYYLYIPGEGVDTVKQSLSIGSLTPHHGFLKENCAACHDNGFNKINDTSCNTCHQVSSHFKPSDAFKSDKFSHIHKGDSNCVSCHMEHKGVATVGNEKLCVSCHAQEINIGKDNELLSVASWVSHPKFKVSKDNSPLKLNHKIHLKSELKSEDGYETLTCSSCHIPDAQSKNFAQISYEKNCKRCHSLEIETGKSVPHGNEVDVINFLRSTYTQLALVKNSESKGDQERIKKPVTVNSPQFYQNEIEEKAREAEKVLYTKTACVVCHEISNTNVEIKDTPMFEVKKEGIHPLWMNKATFSHAVHANEKCSSCHKDVSSSENTSDVLIPTKENCSTCHDKTSELSNCLTCHSFHDGKLVEKGNKK